MGNKRILRNMEEAAKIGFEEAIKLFTLQQINPIQAAKNIKERLETFQENNESLDEPGNLIEFVIGKINKKHVRIIFKLDYKCEIKSCNEVFLRGKTFDSVYEGNKIYSVFCTNNHQNKVQKEFIENL